jgi:hypothetical protein
MLNAYDRRDMKLEIRMGLQRLPKMTERQARRLGDQHMPSDLRKAGFHVCVCYCEPDIHGWHGYRVSYGKSV